MSLNPPPGPESSSDGDGQKRFIGDDRGQTLQDFVIGLSLFLVTVTFVFGIFPNFLDPFTTGVTGDERAQADRVSRTLVSNLSIETGRNTLNATQLRTVLDLSQEQIRKRYGLPDTASVNITVRDLDGNSIARDVNGNPMATSENRKNATAASVGRIVTLDNGRCKPACRMVVQVW